MSEGPDPATILVGIFLIVAGGCIALAGGGCTLFWLGNIGELFRGPDSSLGFLLLAASLVALGIGGFMVRGGMKLMGRRDE
jgi:hypothetical protein